MIGIAIFIELFHRDKNPTSPSAKPGTVSTTSVQPFNACNSIGRRQDYFCMRGPCISYDSSLQRSHANTAWSRGTLYLVRSNTPPRAGDLPMLPCTRCQLLLSSSVHGRLVWTVRSLVRQGSLCPSLPTNYIADVELLVCSITFLAQYRLLFCSS